MKASYHRYFLNFKRPSGTSRGVMSQKETWFLILKEGNRWGIGECGLFRGLSFDDNDDYEKRLRWVCQNIDLRQEELFKALQNYPSIKFGLEQAFLSLRSTNPFELFASDFVLHESPIVINGLIWMGNKDFMMSQIRQKLEEGFTCIKMKIGAIDFDTELHLLGDIRKEFSKNEIELRVDANGAFSPEDAMDKLERLAEYDLHSIEQPIRQGQWQEIAQLCKNTPLPIALDEELIGITEVTKREQLLQIIEPQYIILKPSLVGGFADSEHWIRLAEKIDIGWWVTSALESNIGLNAILQWTYTLGSKLPQGLGTGGLFTNNFNSPLKVKQGMLSYRKGVSWTNDVIERICT